MLFTTKPIMDAFKPAEAQATKLGYINQLALYNQEYNNRTLAGANLKNLTLIGLVKKIGDIIALMDNLDFLNQTYYYNLTYIPARTAYLETIKNVQSCIYDAVLPKELVAGYYQNGAHLKCPNGTTSNRGALCIGQCFRLATSNIAVSILDPSNSTLYISSANSSSILNVTISSTNVLGGTPNVC